MKASELLAKARVLVESRVEEFTCCALSRAAHQEGAYLVLSDIPPCAQEAKLEAINLAVLRAKERIRDLLGGCVTLNVWLSTRHNLPAEASSMAGKVRETRLAWIDDMIAWHQARGD